MTNIVKDSFNRANTTQTTNGGLGLGSTDTGQVWEKLRNGNAYINNNTAQIAGSDNGQVVDSGISDCVIQATFGSIIGNPQLVFRANTSNGNYNFVEYSGGSWHIYQYQSGWTELAKSTDTATAGDVIKVILQGDSITVYRNGNQIMSATSSFQQTLTKHGLGSGNANDTFDNFTVDSLTISTPPVVTINSIDHSKISSEIGVSQAIVTIFFDQDVVQYIARINGVDYNTGTMVHTGGTVTQNTLAQVIIDWNELSTEGDNRINIYGQNSSGQWTPYDSNPVTVQKAKYGTNNYGVIEYGTI